MVLMQGQMDSQGKPSVTWDGTWYSFSVSAVIFSVTVHGSNMNSKICFKNYNVCSDSNSV